MNLLEYDSGSPPRAWGQQGRAGLGIVPFRFTPTGVGTTNNGQSYIFILTVHPHGRGDNAHATASLQAFSGSPPRAWGQRYPTLRQGVKQRFTPTGVGTTQDRPLYSLRHTVHPHGRGDNEHLDSQGHRAIGSPPRAWGQRSANYPWDSRTRFTPTGVGTTWPWRLGPSAWPVHPHGRGDNKMSMKIMSVIIGSPPRAWGQQMRPHPQPNLARFTPTGVGTTYLPYAWPLRWPVHPHGRGDNGLGAIFAGGALGSPPRAWGQQGLPKLGQDLLRFTPTGVGTTSGPRILPCRRSVHPHGRGDNSTSGLVNGASVGSPPRAWGQLQDLVHGEDVGRFTPTGVGTTSLKILLDMG